MATMVKFYQDKQCDKENIDPRSGMRAGLATHQLGAHVGSAAAAGGGTAPDVAARILRDITPTPVFSDEFSGEFSDEADEASEKAKAAASGGDGGDDFIFSDESENSREATTTDKMRGKGTSGQRQQGSGMSSLQKKLAGIDVSVSAENLGIGKSEAAAGKRHLSKKKKKKKGLRRADANVRYGIRSVR
jgi:hypothetical protein